MTLTRAAALIVTTVVAAACGGGASDTTSSPNPTTSGEQDINVLELKCRDGERATTTRFDVAPTLGGAVLEGRLATEEGETSFVCRSPARAAPEAGPRVVVTCTERSQTVHSGRWTVEVTADAAGHHARIDRAAVIPDGPDESLACARITSDVLVEPYADIADYVHRACGVCHDDRFDSLEKIQTQRDLMLGMISSRAMPRRNPAWLDGDEGKAVLAFLAKSPELE